MRPTNGAALASLILGISGFVLCVPLPVTAVLALIFGTKGRKEIRRSGDWQQGAGMAQAGIILGWVGIGVSVVSILGFIALAIGSDSDSWGAVTTLALAA